MKTYYSTMLPRYTGLFWYLYYNLHYYYYNIYYNNTFGLYINVITYNILLRCLAIVFLPLIEALVEFIHYYNTHSIHNSRHDYLGAIPNDLYAMPNYYGKNNITANFIVSHILIN